MPPKLQPPQHFEPATEWRVVGVRREAGVTLLVSPRTLDVLAPR